MTNLRWPTGRAVVASALLALSLAAAAGCGSDSGSADAVDAAVPAAKFSEIYPLLFPPDTKAKCNFCHSMPASNISNGHLHMGMDRAAAYGALVGQTSTSPKCGGKALVVAHHPDKSLLFEKVSANPSCGSRMPLGAAALSVEQLEMIRSWIADGAQDN